MTTTIAGTWSAVLLNGATVYQSGTTTVNGPVVLSGANTVLVVKSGAVVTGLTAVQSLNTAQWTSTYIESGGTITNSNLQTTVNMVQSGGVLSGNTLSNTGDKIFSGGTALGNTKVGGGDIAGNLQALIGGLSLSNGSAILNGATLSNSVVRSGSVATANLNATVIDTTVSAGGRIELTSGASGRNLTAMGGGYPAADAGEIDVGNGAVVSGANLQGGYMAVQGGNARAENTTITSNGWQDVGFNRQTNTYGGGTANNTTLLNGGQQLVKSGGVATNTIVSGSGIQRVDSGGVASSTTILSGGTMTVSAGASAVNPIVSSGASGNILSGGTAVASSGIASGLLIQSGGSLVGAAGGTVLNTIIGAGGRATLNSGGTLASSVISNGGIGAAVAGGVVTDTTISAGGRVTLTSGATGRNLTAVGSGYPAADAGEIDVGNGAVVSGANLQGGYMAVQGGNARAENTTITSNGWQDVGFNRQTNTYGGGTANNTTLLNGGQQLVKSGGVATNTTVSGSGFQRVDSGGVTSSTNVLAGGTMTVSGGGTAVNPVVNSGAFSNILSGATAIASNGIASGLSIQSGASIIGGAGGTILNTVIGQGGLATITSGGTFANSIISSGGIGSSLAEGTVDNATVANGGALNVGSGGSIQNTTVTSGGVVSLGPSAIFSGGVISGGGVLNTGSASQLSGHVRIDGWVSGGVTRGTTQITSGGTAVSPWIASGGTLQIDNGGTLTGTAELAAGGAAVIGGTAGGTINLAGDSFSRLTISGLVSPTTVISGYNGSNPQQSDQIILENIPRNQILGVDFPSDDQVRFTLTGNRTLTLNVPGVKGKGFDLSDGPGSSTIFSVCFLSGTQIMTPTGTRLVDELKPGDEVLVYADGQMILRTITWTGKATVNHIDRTGTPLADYPVRFTAGSMGDNTPYEDLLVTPEHCMYVDGHLIPARMLVNGDSIYHDISLVTYEYFHFQTEVHSIVSANGALAETYLDTGNRSKFHEETGSSLETTGARAHATPVMAAPLNVSREFAEAIWSRYADLCSANRVNYLDCDPELHIETDEGAKIECTRVRDSRYIFRVPSDCHHVFVCSRIFSPSDVIGPFVDDRRKLGVLIGDITLFDADCSMQIDVRNFFVHAQGWHDIEAEHCRWTTGRGVIPLPFHRNGSGARILSIQVLSAGPYSDSAESGIDSLALDLSSS